MIKSKTVPEEIIDEAERQEKLLFGLLSLLSLCLLGFFVGIFLKRFQKDSAFFWAV
jgi:hypothetical protein